MPSVEDPDPYGVKALEGEGIEILEAGTHERPSAEAFEFKPSPSSPVYASFARRSLDSHPRAQSSTWRNSVQSVSSVDRGTQTDEEDIGAATKSVKDSQSLSSGQAPQSQTHILSTEPVKAGDMKDVDISASGDKTSAFIHDHKEGVPN